jgi:hypothetical protein
VRIRGVFLWYNISIMEPEAEKDAKDLKKLIDKVPDVVVAKN